MLASALLLACSAAAAVPNIPTREQLPGMSERNKSSTFAVDATFAELRAAVLAPGIDARKLDAVETLISRTTAPDQEPRARWRLVQDCVALMEALRDGERDAAFRRYALASLFAPYFAEARDLAQLHPEESATAWPGLTALRRELAGDADPRLAEYMERFQPFDGPIPWRKAKRRSLSLERKVLKAHADFAPVLAQIRQLDQSIEDSQFAVSRRLASELGARAALPRGVAQQAAAAARETAEYRVYTVWATLYRRSLLQLLSSKEAAALGVDVQPVRIGWPKAWP